METMEKYVNIYKMPGKREMNRLFEESKRAPIPPEIFKYNVKIATNKERIKELKKNKISANDNKKKKKMSTNQLIDELTKAQAAEVSKKYNDIMAIRVTGKGRKELQNKIKEVNEDLGTFKGKKMFGMTAEDAHIPLPSRGQGKEEAKQKKESKAAAKTQKDLASNKAAQASTAQLSKELSSLKSQIKDASGNQVKILEARVRRVMKKINA